MSAAAPAGGMDDVVRIYVTDADGMVVDTHTMPRAQWFALRAGDVPGLSVPRERR